MNTFVAFIDEVIDSVEMQVASHEPERGGALLGPVGLPIVSQFLFDPQARTSGSTYTPSSTLQQEVAQIEGANSSMELKGILHSHPGDMRRPSGGDIQAFRDSLVGAPWLGRFVTPIVTRSSGDGGHEISLHSGVMSVFIAERSHDGVNLQPGHPRVIPLRGDLVRLQHTFGGEIGSLTTVEIEGSIYLGGSLLNDLFELQVLVGAAYPFSAPVLLISTPGKGSTRGQSTNQAANHLASYLQGDSTVALPIVWDQSVPDSQRLARSLVEQPAPVAAISGGTIGGNARRGIRERLVGITSTSLPAKHVLIVGAGSGGSNTADALVRSGVEQLTVIEPETVETPNLSRSIYTSHDVGHPKVDALRAHLTAINPSVKCHTIQKQLSDVPIEELDRLIRGSDLVIAATDDPGAQRTLNHFAYSRGIPSIYAGVYARGEAGEVVVVVPEITKCYRCTTSTRHAGLQSERQTDYGTGRLTGEPALGSDISHVVTASVKLAIGLLELEEPGAANQFIMSCLTEGYNYLILSMIPDWGFFPDVFKGVAGQFAYQSVWLSAAGDPECSVCGVTRVDPMELPTSTAPKLDNLRPVETSDSQVEVSTSNPPKRRGRRKR